jgi:hypothetical protein
VCCIKKSPPLALDKAKFAGSQICAVGGLTDLGDVMLCQKSLHKSRRMGRHNVMKKLICSIGYSECEIHIAYKVNGISLPTVYTLGESLFTNAQ